MRGQKRSLLYCSLVGHIRYRDMTIGNSLLVLLWIDMFLNAWVRSHLTGCVNPVNPDLTACCITLLLWRSGIWEATYILSPKRNKNEVLKYHQCAVQWRDVSYVWDTNNEKTLQSFFFTCAKVVYNFAGTSVKQITLTFL